MNTTGRVLRAIRTPRLFARGLNRVYYRRAGRQQENTAGIDIFNEDWDTLVVLDACRFDMFEEANYLDGTLSARTSKGSSTVEWLGANFDSRDLRDTVYVTANPQLERNRDRWDISLHKIINVWLDEEWDEDTGTVLADTMTEAAIEAHDRFPNKRIVVHYMQPHYPFVTSDTDFDKEHLSSIDDEDAVSKGESVWGQKFRGQLSVSDEELWSIYVENLDYVLEHVDTLLDTIKGKVVVTSDHGNYVGERASPVPIREYGHPRGLYDDALIRVPWLEQQRGHRRAIRSEDVDSGENIESETVSDRLQALGYHQ